MRTHGYHWFDKGWMANVGHASPIRKVALLYNIFNTRTEGFATGVGGADAAGRACSTPARARASSSTSSSPSARARALGDLSMHSHEFTLEQAVAVRVRPTRRAAGSACNGNLVRGEQHLYLQQPAYGTSYVIGKIETDKLITERRRQLGDAFTMKRFMDEFNAAGLVPISLAAMGTDGAAAR